MNSLDKRKRLKERFAIWRRLRMSGDKTVRKKAEDREMPLSSARKGWMGFPTSAAPFGTSVTRNYKSVWMREFEPKPAKPMRTKRAARVSALTRIAQQLPRKLPVILPKP